MFDEKAFAYEYIRMVSHAKELLPNDLNVSQKEYIIKTLRDYIMQTERALYNDKSLKLTVEQTAFITEIIATWTFHKSVDLFRANIDEKYWDSILQKIAFTIFEVAKQAVIRDLSKEQLLQVVEHHVVKVYKKCIEDLEQEGIIDEKTKEQAKRQSNIDKVLEEDKQKNKLINKIKAFGVNLFQNPKDNIMYKNLKTDELRIEVGFNYSEMLLNLRIAIMQQELGDELGYIIPHVNVVYKKELDSNEYKFYIHDVEFEGGHVYPEKYMVIADQVNQQNIQFEFETIKDEDPTYKTDVFWITKEDVLNKCKDAICVDARDVLVTHFQEFVIEHVDNILTIKETYKYIEAVKENYSKRIVKSVLKLIDISEIRRILVNLIKEKVSIKDIGYIFELISDFGRYSNKSYILSERIRAALSKQIMNKNTIDGILYALTLGKNYESMLIESVQNTETVSMFMLKPDVIKSFAYTVAKYLMESHQKYGNQPVIIVDPKIRLALYDLLVRQIPTIVVISFSELTTDIEVKKVGTIE